MSALNRQDSMKRKKIQGSLSHEAYERLRQMILRGLLPMGTPLSRRSIAEQFGMSLLPVGEALQRLENEGLVESRPRVGTRVRIPTAMDIRGHYVVREALESQSARLFAEKASPDERREIQQMAVELDRMNERSLRLQGKAKEDALYEEYQLHMRFHMRVAECTACQALCDAIEKNHTLLLNWHYSNASAFHQLPPRWHQILAEALCSGSPLRADRAMRKHVRYGMEEVLRRLQQHENAQHSATQRFKRGPRSAKLLLSAR